MSQINLNLPELFDWQKIAYQKWKDNNCKGTTKIGTGGGKSILGYKIISDLDYNDKILIVVPTTHLQNQHKQNLIKYGYKEEEIGLVGNGNKDFDKCVTIAVVNSIRYNLLKDKKYDLLIMDECHNYFTLINANFILAGEYKKVLGLSATPEREDNLHTEYLKQFPIIYNYSQYEAIQDKLICDYKIINIGVKLVDKEEKEYIKNNDYITINFPRYNYDLEEVQRSLKNKDWNAARLMKAISKRRQIIQKSVNKVFVAYNLIEEELENHSKILVFNEFIEAVNMLEAWLKNKEIEYGIYHSKMKDKEKDKMLEDFKNDKFNVMLSVKALDEGVNVVNCDTAIIVGGSSSQRQQLQRIGRILRQKEGKFAKVYQIYIRSYDNINSKDEDWMRKRMIGIKGVDVEWRII